MHLLLIHQAFVLPGEPGGTRHFELGRHLVNGGDNFTVIASDRVYLTGEAVEKMDDNAAFKLIDGIRVLRAYTYPALHRSFIWRVISFISFMFSSIWAGLTCGPIDVVMGTSPPIFQAFSAWTIAAIRRRPLLLEVRDLWPEFAIDMGVLKNPLLITISQWLENFLYNRATHILVNSPAYRDYIIQKGIDSEKVTLIPNGVEPLMFDPSKAGEQIRTRWNLQEKFVATYAGALGTANDIPTILRAAQKLSCFSDVHFFIVGDGMKRGELEDFASVNNLTNVTFTGAVPKSEMVDILAASDACIATLQDIPMFKTTYPNKVFDYMAAGRPTILGIDGVIRDVVEQARGGIFIHPGNHEQLAEAILDLFNDRDASKKMGADARIYVEKHFDRAVQARRFVELVHQFQQK